jgi:AcrR family transcriptional regulator
MDGTAGKPEDLRARVREGTRIEVGMIALDLFAEKGFEATTAGEAADAAGISRASFFRLFSSKEEAVFARQEATGAVIAATLAERPPEEDHWTALQSAFKASTARYLEDPERALARSRLILENPSLRARRLEVHADWSPAICGALASRMGDDAESMKIGRRGRCRAGRLRRGDDTVGSIRWRRPDRPDRRVLRGRRSAHPLLVRPPPGPSPFR